MKQSQSMPETKEEMDVRERNAEVKQEEQTGSWIPPAQPLPPPGRQFQSFGNHDAAIPNTDTYEQPGENAAANEPENSQPGT